MQEEGGGVNSQKGGGKRSAQHYKAGTHPHLTRVIGIGCSIRSILEISKNKEVTKPQRIEASQDTQQPGLQGLVGLHAWMGQRAALRRGSDGGKKLVLDNRPLKFGKGA